MRGKMFSSDIVMFLCSREGAMDVTPTYWRCGCNCPSAPVPEGPRVPLGRGESGFPDLPTLRRHGVFEQMGEDGAESSGREPDWGLEEEMD